ncbi:MAG TPA: VOC family protein [Hyphomicrobium sp.]|nr:VOC family protein [Hyphomicrobium sp.]
MAVTQKIRTCLWFDREAEDAANFYVSLFENSRVLGVSRYGNNMPLAAGTIMTIDFELAGTKFMALNGGPLFKFTEASSMVVDCESQSEIDRLWSAFLFGGGREQQCGWLKDRFGLSWQIVPSGLRELISGATPAQAQRLIGALMRMVKLDIAGLEAAYSAGD